MWKSLFEFEKLNKNQQILPHSHKKSKNLEKLLEIVVFT